MATKADLAELKAEIREELVKYKVETIKWMRGVSTGAAAVGVSFSFLMQRLLG